MQIVLINPNTTASKGINKATVEPPIGIGYLASYLRKEGFDCSLIDANILQLDEKQIVDRISRDAKIIGISFNVVSAISAFKLVRYLKAKFPESLFIGGGPHPSSLPKACLLESDFDAVCVGEGEETLLAIAKNVNRTQENPFAGVEGVYYKDQNEIIRNPQRALIQDLDSLPFVDFGLFPDLSLYKTRARGKPVGVVLTSRGCVFRCVYCNKGIFQEIHRSRSVDNVIAEIRQQIERFGIKQLDFLDDNLTFDIKYANDLFEALNRNNFNLHINLQNGVRADLLNEDLIQKMKKAGVFKVSIGVESGDSRIQRIIKKNLNLDKVLESTRLFKKYGIKVYGNFMFGLPYDNEESMQKTIDFAIKMNPDIANFMITIPLPGTELSEIIKNKGVFLENLDKGSHQGFYGGKVYYALEGMDAQKTLGFYKKSYKAFYFRFKKIVDIILGIRSFSELKWIAEAIGEIAQSIF
jgi:anaerobic magnesium-protoporphyrin IX monomethyl ester cyclase